jgi:phage-related protein
MLMVDVVGELKQQRASMNAIATLLRMREAIKARLWADFMGVTASYVYCTKRAAKCLKWQQTIKFAGVLVNPFIDCT